MTLSTEPVTEEMERGIHSRAPVQRKNGLDVKIESEKGQVQSEPQVPGLRI